MFLEIWLCLLNFNGNAFDLSYSPGDSFVNSSILRETFLRLIQLPPSKSLKY